MLCLIPVAFARVCEERLSIGSLSCPAAITENGGDEAASPSGRHRLNGRPRAPRSASPKPRSLTEGAAAGSCASGSFVCDRDDRSIPGEWETHVSGKKWLVISSAGRPRGLPVAILFQA